jgi:hypothetical protein
MNPIDTGLARLRRDGLEHELDHLEGDVLSRIGREARSDVFRGRALPIQLAVSCVALLAGLAMAELVRTEIAPRSEAAVLSEDSGLAPSIALEGGA